MWVLSTNFSDKQAYSNYGAEGHKLEKVLEQDESIANRRYSVQSNQVASKMTNHISCSHPADMKPCPSLHSGGAKSQCDYKYKELPMWLYSIINIL